MPSMPSLKRGDIVRVRLDPVEGSEQAGERPALVISPDVINEHSPVILIAALTSQKTEGRCTPPHSEEDWHHCHLRNIKAWWAEHQA